MTSRGLDHDDFVAIINFLDEGIDIAIAVNRITGNIVNIMVTSNCLDFLNITHFSIYEAWYTI